MGPKQLTMAAARGEAEPEQPGTVSLIAFDSPGKA